MKAFLMKKENTKNTCANGILFTLHCELRPGPGTGVIGKKAKDASKRLCTSVGSLKAHL